MGEHVDIMAVDDVDAIEPKPLEREIERAHDAVVAVVENLAARRRLEEPGLEGAIFRPAELQQAPDFGRDQVGVARLGAEEAVQPRLGQAKPVDRRGVEMAAAGGPGGVERSARLLLRDRPIEIAERRGAETELGEL